MAHTIDTSTISLPPSLRLYITTCACAGECGKNNNSNPCEHICLDLHDGTYECSCFYGFALAVDGYSCAPIASTATSAQTPSSLPSDLTASESAPMAADLAAGDPTQSGVDTSAKLKRKSLAPLGGQRANDNRKLADELARGAAKLSRQPGRANIGGQIDETNEAKREGRRRHRRLLGARLGQDGRPARGADAPVGRAVSSQPQTTTALPITPASHELGYKGKRTD